MKSKTIAFLTVWVLTQWNTHAHAALSFGTNISDANIEEMTKNFASLSHFQQLRGASPMGTIFAFDLGIHGSLNSTSGLKDTFATATGTDIPSSLPFARFVARAGGPLGLSAGVGYFPSLSLGGASIGSWAFDARWSYGGFVGMPIDLDVRFHMSNLDFKYDATSGAITQEVTFNAKTWGISKSVGKKLSVGVASIEPYAGVGFISLSGDFGTAASVPGLVATGAGTSKSAKTYEAFAGLDVSLLTFRAGLEAGLVGGSTKFGANLAFTF